VVEAILKTQKKPLNEIMGNVSLLRSMKPAQYTNEHFGLPTVQDIFLELEKPGRDPRPEFKTAVFKEGIEALSDLRSGMILEGVVTNVSNFGAFVDIGVHQDGLVHISMLADRYVKNPNEVVKVGDIVKVKVLEIDIQRKRIQLSMRLTETPVPTAHVNKSKPVSPDAKNTYSSKNKPQEVTLGATLLEALQRKK
jgi:uncharacterized protein